jgi:NitT/TauT family transport system substrate-binding protein
MKKTNGIFWTAKGRTPPTAFWALLTVVMGVMVFTGFTGCEKKAPLKEAAGEAAREILPLTIIYTSNVVGLPLVTLAKEKHYFEEEGLKPEFIILSSGAIEALSIGKADIYLNGLIPPLSYASQKADVKIVGGTASGGNLVITKPENAAKYARLEDWKGVRLGTVRISTSEMVSRYALGQIGFNMDAESKNQDIIFVEIENYPNIIEGVRKGQVDIGFVDYAYQQSALDLGLTILFPMTDMYENYVCCRQTANKTALANKRDAFVAFHRAQIRAYKDYYEQHEETIALLAKLSSQEPEYVRNLLYNPQYSAGRTFHPDPDFNRVKPIYETLLQYNYISGDVPFEDMIDCTVYRDALKEIIARHPNDAVYQRLAREFEENNSLSL